MAWTAPRTWVTAEVVTDVLMNAHIRDNFLETEPATVTTVGDLAYADAANSMGNRLALERDIGLLVSDGTDLFWRVPATDTNTGSATASASNTGYINLGFEAVWPGFDGDPISVTVTTGTAALVLFKAKLSNDTAGAVTQMSYAVSGATTVAAADTHSIGHESGSANDTADFGGFDFRTGLTAGTNTFGLHARVVSGIPTIRRPEITVIPFG